MNDDVKLVPAKFQRGDNVVDIQGNAGVVTAVGAYKSGRKILAGFQYRVGRNQYYGEWQLRRVSAPTAKEE